jgi:hypothetical protein
MCQVAGVADEVTAVGDGATAGGATANFLSDFSLDFAAR